MPDDIILSAKHVTKIFGSGATAVHAVDDVSLDVRRGELVLIKGPSGSGKTTLLSILGALMSPTSGTVALMGTEIATLSQSALAHLRARQIGFVFQAYNLLSALSVEQNILFPARLAGRDFGQAMKLADRLILRLNLDSRRHARPDQLSGGEKQRVAVARALINDAPLILADEPTGNLDSQRGLEVAMILHDIAREGGKAVVIVTHDPRIEDIADRILWLEDGKLRDRKRKAQDWTRDPVCGMRVDKWTATMHADYEGEAYSFCSQRCRDRFTDEPARYAAKAP